MATQKVVGQSKAERRLARRAESEKKRLARVEVDVAKIVGQQAQPPCGKTPVLGEPPPVLDRNMAHADDLHDKEGEWSWGVARDWGEQVWTTVLQPALQGFTRLTWREIRAERAGKHPKHHEYEIHLICPEAYRRLEEIELDDQDHIFRFRLDGQKRLYGFRFDEVFKTVWYDPTHQIFPVKKDKSGVRDKQNKRKVERARKRKREAAKGRR